MNCFICGSDNVVLTFKAKNDVKISVCSYCYDYLLEHRIKCSHCNCDVINHDCDIELNAKIGKNGIVCATCEANGISIEKGSFVFRRIPNNLKTYSYKPNPVFKRLDNEQDNLFMGVELEIGGLHEYETVKKFCNEHGGHIFYFKSDGSIRGQGCEIVTHPATLGYHLSDCSGWKELFNDFNRVGFVSGTDTNTGLHVHINRNVLDATQMKKIDLVVNQWSDLFKCIGRRTQDSYCRYTPKLHSQWGRSDSRYQSVNFSNRNTVEFRFFCGTNNVEELFASLESVKIIVLMTKNITYDDLYENEEAVKNKMKEIMKSENFIYFSKMMVKNTRDNSWAI